VTVRVATGLSAGLLPGTAVLAADAPRATTGSLVSCREAERVLAGWRDLVRARPVVVPREP